MNEKLKKRIYTVIALFIFAFLGFALFRLAVLFLNLEHSLLATLLTVIATVLGSTVAIMYGKYHERKMSIESDFRKLKIEIYDEFFREFFHSFYENKQDSLEKTDLTEFLREWQRKFMLWGSKDVLERYVDFMKGLSKYNGTIYIFVLYDELVKAIREDLGHKNTDLPKGFFNHFLLTNSPLLVELLKVSPFMPTEEFSKLEKELEASQPKQGDTDNTAT